MVIDMFLDKEKVNTETTKISAKEKENKISELIHWVKYNLKDEDIADFTHDKFNALSAFINALQQTYQALGVRGAKGLESDFVLFIAGSNKNKVYVSYIVVLTERHKGVFQEKLGAQLHEIDQNLSKLTWR
jgi:hypothetical protein